MSGEKAVKAVIMAGGEGTRLRPLTCDLPKPMARLLGRPVIEYILDLLDGHGIRRAAITLGYLSDAIEAHFESGAYRSVQLEMVREDAPLGTAGSVRNACEDGESTVLVISGDAMCGFDLSAALRFHRENGADATLLVKKVADPREYGLVDIREDNSIAGFVEKPAFSQAISELANTGVYLLSAAALSLIPKQGKYDFAKDLFPEMLSRGMKLMAFEEEGYWCDIGDISTYIGCQHDMLAGALTFSAPGTRRSGGSLFKGSRPRGEYRLEGSCYIGSNVRLGGGCVIENSVIDDGCTLLDGARVTNSVLLPGAYVGENASLTGALLCAGSSVLARAMLFEGSAVGSGAVIGARSIVHPDIRIWPGKSIPEAVTITEHIRTGGISTLRFYDEGISGETGVVLTAGLCTKLGCALGTLSPGMRIAVSSTPDRAARVFKNALCAGIQATGANVLNIGDAFASMPGFFMLFCGLEIGVHITGGAQGSIRLVGEGGLPVTRPVERSLEGFMARGEFSRPPHTQFGEMVDMSGMRLLYAAELLKYAPYGLGGMAVSVSSENRMTEELLRQALGKLGCLLSGKSVLHISADGARAELVGPAPLTHEGLLALACRAEFERGRDVALPFEAPRAIDALAKSFGRAVLRYYSCPADTSDKRARALAKTQLWTRDALMLCVKVLSYARFLGVGLEELAGTLPVFAFVQRVVDTPDNPAALLRNLNTQRTGGIGEGVLLSQNGGTLLLRPMKRGRGIKIFAESVSVEAAMELCDEISALIEDSQQKNRS